MRWWSEFHVRQGQVQQDLSANGARRQETNGRVEAGILDALQHCVERKALQRSAVERGDKSFEFEHRPLDTTELFKQCVDHKTVHF